MAPSRIALLGTAAAQLGMATAAALTPDAVQPAVAAAIPHAFEPSLSSGLITVCFPSRSSR